MTTISKCPIRVNYFDGETLNREDFAADQSYFRGIVAEHNRSLHVWGIITGLDVVAAREKGSIVIKAGCAIDGEGREIRLQREILSQAPMPFGGTYAITLRHHQQLDGRTDETAVAGFKEISETPEISWTGGAPLCADTNLLLAIVTVDANGSVTSIDPDCRRWVGINVSKAQFILPNMRHAEWPLIEGWEHGASSGLRVEAPELRIKGTLTVEDIVAVGTMSPEASLSVTGGAELLVLLGSEDRADFVVTRERNVGIGLSEPAARLHVAAGNIGLQEGRGIEFTGLGRVEAFGESIPESDPDSILFDGANQQLASRASGEIQFQSGFSGVDFFPNVILTKEGKAGVGLAGPVDYGDALLLVEGIAQSTSGGLMFPDGSIQTTAAIAVSVPIGTILEWWRPDQSTPVPKGFRICSVSPNDPSLPDAANRYLRGTSEWSEVGRVGGASSHNHALSVPQHTHAIDHQHPPLSPWLGPPTEIKRSNVAPDCILPNSNFPGRSHSHGIDSIEIPPYSGPSGQASDNTWQIMPHDNDPKYVGLLLIIRVEAA